VDALRLTEARSGVRYRIVSIKGDIPDSAKDLGIFAGNGLSLVSRFPLGGPLLLDLGAYRVALSRKAAEGISVEPFAVPLD